MFFFYDDENQGLSNSSLKLLEVIIKRECCYNSVLNVRFSQHHISVIYGENGCGKTTLLRLLNAFFEKNDNILLREKVLEMTVIYKKGDEKESVSVIRSDLIEKDEGEELPFDSNHYDWSMVNSKLFDISCILFGVNRGISRSTHVTSDELFNSIIRTSLTEKFENREDLIEFCEFLSHNLERNQRLRRGRNIRNLVDLSDPVLTIDDISMEVIEQLLLTRYNRAKKLSINKVQKALFATLADACDHLEDVEMSDDEFVEILENNREQLITALIAGDSNSLSERIVDILRRTNISDSLNEIGHNPLLRKLIVNMSLELKDESIFLQTINKLTNIYNEYIGPEKYLDITENEVVIKFHHSSECHGISALSSGERHLLVLLTIFVIEGDKRNFFMVDEPEISLNMMWQRRLLPLLHELAPNAEIIVASHSPSVARENTNYLVELRSY